MHPPLRAEDGESEEDETGDADREVGVIFPLTNRESSVKGLAVLVGGDPEKNGGDDANWVADCPCKSSNRIKSRPNS